MEEEELFTLLLDCLDHCDSDMDTVEALEVYKDCLSDTVDINVLEDFLDVVLGDIAPTENTSTVADLLKALGQ